MQRFILARLGRGESENPHPLCSPGAIGQLRAQAIGNGDGDQYGDSLSGPPQSEPRDPQDGPRGPGRKKWRWLVLAGAIVALAAWGLREHWLHPQFRWNAFAESFVDLQWHWIVAALILALATYYGRALRWAVMLKPLRPKPDTWGIFKATAIGFTAVVLLGRPGEFVRPYLISLKERVPFSSQLAAWFLERILDLLAILLVFGFAVSRIRSSRASLGPTFRWVLETGGYTVAILGVICLVLLVMMGRFSALMRRRLVDALRILPERHHARLERTITAFMDGTASTKTHGSALKLSLYTAVEWMLIVLCFACLFKAYDETAALTLHDVVIFMGFVAFGSVLQIPGVGGGVQIVSIVVLTQLYGISLEVATSLAIMLWAITFVAIVPAGLLLAFHEGFNWRKLKELEKCAVRAGSAIEYPGPTGEPNQ
jgi:uncharacterized protein (TIRG00374 family)